MSSDPIPSADDATPTETASSDVLQIDPVLTLTLAQASLAAYNDYQGSHFRLLRTTRSSPDLRVGMAGQGIGARKSVSA
jgi:hypothetical protein